MITKAAESKTNFAKNLVFTRNARSAWGHLLRGVKGATAPSVLLPSYIGITDREGSGVFDPISETASTYAFYKLDGQLRIDLDDFARCLQTGNLDVVLVIHYFGFCRNDMDHVSKICAAHGVLLVEDCAHALQRGILDRGLGSFGEYSFYSLHKYMATDSGGVLKINSDRVRLPQLPSEDGISLDSMGQYIKTNFSEVANARIDNFKAYLKYLPVLDEVKVMYELGEGEVPYSFPVRIKGGMREKLYFHLNNRGIPVTALYYRLIEEIKEDLFPVSYDLSREILNFPVHQDITPVDVEVICSVVDEFYRT
ncbi:DegT/DnrJ/EryC1/StrS family aminotransferase [Caenimonas terrae]|uniref:DegT/DnrJ/EryC1/StrS family aminotransferase n=1 Tax=Caenimonas terrae TaxID=696074 RepID=A0ABW0NCL9_9BURK